MEQRFSDNDVSGRDIPSFIEPPPPLINNPFMRPRPQKGTNLLELFEEDAEPEEPDLVQVYLRMKPHEGPNSLYEVRSDKCLVTSLDTATAGHGRRTQHNVSRMYTFSRIFDAHCSQKEIFEQVVKENLKKLPEGHSFTLLTYGASGSGKTYTLMGTVKSPGLIPRSLEYVFKLVDASPVPLYKPSDGGADTLGYSQQQYELQWVKRLCKMSDHQRDKYRRMSAQLKNDLTTSNFDLTNRTKYYVWVSFVEIYNEAIYDLLAPPDKRTKLLIREDSKGQVFVKGVTQAFVRTGLEAYDVMVAGKLNLVVAATGVHAQSSRSHCIFTITMLTETDGEIRTSCIRLCDLAGCERARATRNTGARMQESRAINSSLHVLERCLHMLRRNQKQRQEALVPYRESKLTRLLGSGLSGSRGEAVSMVVTLNPAPQYAQETKHVLLLAAVAQDIQINNTVMFASTLESSAQDSTISSTTELMKLRSENELLHFELLQAQARTKEAMAMMEEKQQQAANTMRELVEEAKDMTRQYYQAQIDALRSEMEDMIEEYESRLVKASAPPAAAMGTPTRYLQAKVAQLIKEKTILEDQLSAEKQARTWMEEELKHLRTCIAERDEKTYKEIIPDPRDMVLTDSDDDNTDPFNQSLEPVFRKELNRSKAVKTDCQVRTTLHLNDKERLIDKEHLIDTERLNDKEHHDDKEITSYEDESDIDKSTGDMKQNDNDDDDDTPRNSDYATGDESEIKDSAVDFTDTLNKANNAESKIEEPSYTESKTVNECVDGNVSGVRGTYFVSDVEQDNGPNDSVEVKNEVRGTYFVRKSTLSSSDDEDIENKVNNLQEIQNDVKATRPEKARGTYFVKKSIIDLSSDEENEDNQTEHSGPRETYFVRTSAIDTSIDEEMQEVVEHKALPKEHIIVNTKVFTPPKIESEILVNKIIKSLKKSTHGNVSDSSLRQFEQLETAFDKCKDDITDRNIAFGDIKILKEKRTYFDEDAKVDELHVTAKTDPSESFISSNKTKDNKVENKIHVSAKTDCTESLISSNKSKENKIEDKLHVSAKTDCTESLISSNKSKDKVEDKLFVSAKTDFSESVISSNKTKDKVEDKLFVSAKTDFSESVISSNKTSDNMVHDKSHATMKTDASETLISFNKSKDNVKVVDMLHITAKTDSSETFISCNKTKESIKKCDDIEKSTDFVEHCTNSENTLDAEENKTNTDEVLISKSDTEKRTYFDNIEVSYGHIPNRMVADIITSARKYHERSPSIVSDDNEKPSEPSTMKKLLGENIAKLEVLSSINKVVKKHESIDVFEGLDSPVVKSKQTITATPKTNCSNLEEVRKSIEKLVLKQKTRNEVKLETLTSVEEPETIKNIRDIPKVTISKIDQTSTELNETRTKQDNTIEAFENIYKDLSTHRPTEFDLLAATTQDTESNDKKIENDEVKENKKTEENLDKEGKYNLRHKSKLNLSNDKKTNEEVLLESTAKCESKKLSKRSLRLRRRKNEDDSDPDSDKLKDILNLKKEFSDVTMGLPALKKEVKDIPSPEKLPGEENAPLLMGIQSCPSKSVTRSRRKLFTPRAEPLEESLSQAGDSNERIYVPRPSYHRARARRKL